MKILHVDSSILGNQSASRQLTAAIVATLKMKHPSPDVVYHDLAEEQIGHLTMAELAVLRGADPDEAIQERADRNARHLGDFLAADIVVIGAPMYNLSLPSQLKAWLDRLAVAGRTFRYTAHGAEGLVKGKRVVIASSRGGFHSEGYPTAFLDHQESYLKGLLGFLGIVDISFVRAEGLGVSAERRTAALDAASSEIQKLFA